MTTNHPAIAEDFSDRRVFVALDPTNAKRFGTAGFYYSQSATGPTRVEIDREVDDSVLAKLAGRHGLVLGELLAFRDRASLGAVLLAAPAEVLQ